MRTPKFMSEGGRGCDGLFREPLRSLVHPLARSFAAMSAPGVSTATRERRPLAQSRQANHPAGHFKSAAGALSRGVPEASTLA